MLSEDEGLGKPNRGGSDADLDITPMIDVTFLLLIFFMVTSTMQESPTVDVPPARSGVGSDTTESVTIYVKSAGGGDKPTIEIDGKQATLDDVRKAVQAAMQAETPKTNAIVMADREVPHGFVVEVEKAIAETEGMTLSIGVRDVSAKK
jgi:biopolymer transport protein ExbD